MRIKYPNRTMSEDLTDHLILEKLDNVSYS